MFRLTETLGAYQKRDPAARSKIEIFILYPGVHALIYHRFAHFLYRHHLKFLARFVSQWSRFWTGIEIHPGAKIGHRFVIDHGMGIVIGETAEVGDDVLLYQGVTLGGTGKDRGKRHPTVGNNVMIGCGAKVLGPFVVGENSRIAANAVVLTEVPPNSTAVGVPARVVRIGGSKVDYATEVDQIHVTDPVQKELQALQSRVEFMENLLEECKKDSYLSRGNEEGQE
jgi:serine O-acetyltransferase